MRNTSIRLLSETNNLCTRHLVFIVLHNYSIGPCLYNNYSSSQVYHVYNFPDQAVNNASKQLVDSHATAFANEKILMQVITTHGCPFIYILYHHQTHLYIPHMHSLTPSPCTQRQWIRIVPVSEARCDYKGKSFNYFVYGYNTLVHAPEYPQQMCCGCSIV